MLSLWSLDLTAICAERMSSRHLPIATVYRGMLLTLFAPMKSKKSRAVPLSYKNPKSVVISHYIRGSAQVSDYSVLSKSVPNNLQWCTSCTNTVARMSRIIWRLFKRLWEESEVTPHFYNKMHWKHTLVITLSLVRGLSCIVMTQRVTHLYSRKIFSIKL